MKLLALYGIVGWFGPCSQVCRWSAYASLVLKITVWLAPCASEKCCWVRKRFAAWPVDYYPKFGFTPAVDYRLDWPGFIEPERLKFFELIVGSSEGRKKTGLAVRGIAPSD